MSTPHPSSQRDPSRFNPRLKARARIGAAFHVACFLATALGIVVLGVLLFDIARDGWSHLSIGLITNSASYMASRAGIKPALVGSLWMMAVTTLIAFPLGVATAIWLEEYSGESRWKSFVEMNIANLAGVPSIVYGILGLAVFVHFMSLGRSVLAGALTLALLILPVVIIASQEAIKAVPNSIRLGAYALGATRWETTRFHVFPLALPGILTGTILALSRAVGEAAPLIVVGALAYVAFVPMSPLDTFTVMPIQIFNWISDARTEFHGLAAASILVLLAFLLTMNAAAIFLRNRYSRKN